MRHIESTFGAISSGEQTITFLLAVEHDFDRVWNDGLVLRFKEILLPNFYIHLTVNFLSGNRNFRMSVDGALSEDRTFTA